MSLDALALAKTSARLMDDFKANLVFKLMTNQDYEGEVKFASSLTIFMAPIPSTATYTRDSTTISYQRMIPSEQKLEIRQRKYWGIKADDLEKQLALQGGEMWSRTVRNGAFRLARDVDTHISTVMAAAVPTANILTARTVGGAGASAYELLVDMATTLKNNDVPMGDCHVAIPPGYHGLLTKDVRFTGFNTAEARRTIKGEVIGEIEDLKIHISTDVPLSGSTYTIIACSREGTTCAEQLSEVEMVPRDKDDFDDRIRSQLVFDAKVTQPQALVKCAIQIAS